MNVYGCIDFFDGYRMVGWAFDRDAPGTQFILQLFIDRTLAVLIHCNQARPDLVDTTQGLSQVGFDVAIPLQYRGTGSRVAELYARSGVLVSLTNSSTGTTQAQWPFDLKVGTTEQNRQFIIGIIDEIQNGIVRGWAYDPKENVGGISLALYVDGEHVANCVCDIQRDDLAAANHLVAQCGYEHPIPDRFYDDQAHTLEFRSHDGRDLHFASNEDQPGSVRPFILPSATYIGHVDGMRDGAVQGWAFRHEKIAKLKTGGLHILVTMQHQPVAQIRAHHFRPDVATAHGSQPNCGFVFYPPSRLVAGRTVEFRFKVIPGGIELAGSPYTVEFPSLETIASIRDLQEATDKVFTGLWLLRDRLRKMVPDETFTVHNYDPWARRYYAAQAAAPDKLAEFVSSSLPLISVVCPVFRPRIADFTAAVHSVVAQSYKNWELIIVDDASGSIEITALIKKFAREDKRIKPILLRNNVGISSATNAALTKVRGHYVAFFDHDDLLTPRALEFMTEAALRTGARLLYCDEDKIDDWGLYSEVNLKPDWNYRLLLSQNYICHLLFVARGDLEKAGPLRSECDGAQDHDLIIRLTEFIPPAQIHHVPEILYHWRKTPTSTASSGKSKAYAVAAGAKAIQDHLERRGLVGHVSSPREITCYEIDWTLAQTPSVTILIPYREQVGMTRECMSALLGRTNYVNYNVILIDNWSTSDQALTFSAEMQQIEHVSVFRVEEPFNYSRLNNLAAAQTQAEFILFMNNDVVVHDPAWLQIMVGEMLSDESIGVVGNKLYYPNGTVQHGGVILGVGGVADHAHRGITSDEPGYAARAICAQDLSAVTAACLLCRHTAFDSVGGFDEVELTVAFNDVDLCLRIKEKWRIVWTPRSSAEHRESLSRGSDLQPDQQARFFHENEIMVRRWGPELYSDRAYNPHFSRRTGIFSSLNDIPG